MVAYTYSRVSALNFNTTPPSVAKSATGSVYAVADTTFTTPLNLTLVVGGVTTTSISADANGFFPDFTVDNRTSVVWKQSGSAFTSVLTTTDPVPGPKGDPGNAGAKGDKGDRGDLASWQPNTWYPLNQVISNPVGDLVKVTTAHTSGASYDAAKFDYVVPPTLTPAALNATYVPKWKANTVYASGDKVVSPNGDVVIAKAAFTSGSSYDASKWDFSTSLIPRIVHYDVFDRADGAPGTAPTGQTYMTHQSVTNGLGRIVGGEFVSTRIDGVTNAVSSYIGINFKETPVKFVQRFTQLGSSTGVSAASIVFGGRADGADSTIPEIIDRSVHLTCTATGITVQFRDKATYPDGVYPAVTGSSYGRLPNTTAGQEYEWSVTRIAPDVLEIVDPNGKVNTVQHPDIERLAGRAVYWQCVEQQATGGNETRLQGMWTYCGPIGQTLPPLKSATKRPLDVAAAGALTEGQIAHLAGGGTSTEIDVLNRASTITALNATSGMLNVTYFTPRQDMSVSRCEFSCGATWATGITLFQYGLFSAASDGAITLLAQTDPANTAGFSFADHIAEKPFVASGSLASSVVLKAGTRYAVGIMIIATTPGTVKGLAVDKTITKYRNPMFNGQLGGQTAMPTSLTAAQVAASSNMFWARLKV